MQRRSESSPGPRDGPRRAELLAALSLAIDLGLGQPMEHMLRSAVLAGRIAERMGLDARQQAVVYYANLVAWIGCHADSHELAQLFGDDIALRADTYGVDMRGLPFLRMLTSHVGRGLEGARRGVEVVAFLLTARRRMAELIGSHCASAGTLSDRVGLDRQVGAALAYAFERWDGAGLPAGVRGDDIPLEMHIVHLAEVSEVHLRAGGPGRAVEVARARSGTQFCPRVARVFQEAAGELTDGLLEQDAWAAALDRAPDRARVLAGDELDTLLRAMADFVDLKVPCLLGHSRAVAELTAAAGRLRGLPATDVEVLYRAGLVHGLGRMGVSNRIWEKPGPLTGAEWERVRLYPYLTGRILSRVTGMEDVVAVATTHRERLDGSGYPNGVRGRDLSVADRLLAAAETYQRFGEPRPHRGALTPEHAAGRLRQEAHRGRLDAEAVEAVLTAAGHRRVRRAPWPAGLTAREVEVLRLVARGRSNRQIADELCIAEKTARNHVERVYAKLGVDNRTRAGLAAVDLGLAW
ncbi:MULTISPECIES: HD domain-containing phosphohydrolase [unclassified Rhodococcus (in: high G+C Gram-positive bacteria)]|uniref:HD domain-containing phosphohydrolase n=1 Tax=unclassified Rhodococcus (in: high G+C Gram-positive bacteria) TaxID=192944 RepID=UPI001386DFA0|nr:HD domain-containing phosphohydrolase [Rhodococcus sp. DMU1]NCL76502.1 3'3'-cGAMP-specific phosphodiesterase 3 [Rhodococcus sp. YH1]QIX51442.1 HD domain-containing protein [Rhodococcus sp. DMU1]